ncbi:MAG: hypothetical protein ACOX40_07525 [Bacilli bacterium]|jgi:uncharacterized protein YcfL
MKKILRLLIIGLMFFVFTGCHKEWQRLFDELEQIERSGNYDIVGTIGIVNGLDRFHFVEEINKKVKNDGKEVKDDPGYLEHSIFLGDRLYFIYRYYWSGIKKGSDYNSSTDNYCFGYIDLLGRVVNVLEYYDNISVNATANLYNIIGDHIFLVMNNKLLVYGITERDVVEEYDFTSITVPNAFNVRHKTIMIKTDQYHRFFYDQDGNLQKNDIATENIPINYFENFIYGNNAVYRQSKGDDYYGYNIITKDQLSEEEVLEVVDQYLAEYNMRGFTKYKKGENEYLVSVSTETITFKNTLTEEVETLTLEEVKNKSDAYRKISTLYERDLYFSYIITEGEVLYVVLINRSGFFGLYDGSPPPIVFKYDIENDELSYLGYYAYVYYKPVKLYSK